MSFLELESKTFVIFGVANKKSVAFHIAQGIEREGGNVVYVVHSAQRLKTIQSIVSSGAEIFVCDVSNKDQIVQTTQNIAKKHSLVHGVVHSIAYANYEDGKRPFHETAKDKFLQTMDISCFSLVAIADAFKEILDPHASVITISISTTEMASENYGWMAPAKAALNSTVCFLAKSFSQFSCIRFNALCPGLLKTSSSAGIPGYLDAYLYAEQCTLRKQAVKTSEVANAGLFLLSPASSGINAQHIIIDAGMRINYFDTPLVKGLIKNLYS